MKASRIVLPQLIRPREAIAIEPGLPSLHLLHERVLIGIARHALLDERVDGATLLRLAIFFMRRREARCLLRAVSRPQDQDHEAGLAHAGKTGHLRRMRLSAEILCHDRLVADCTASRAAERKTSIPVMRELMNTFMSSF